MKYIFRTLVVGSMAIQVIWFLLPYATAQLYEDESLILLSWNGFGAYIDAGGPVPYALLLAYTVTSIGLFFLKRWARTGLVFLTVFAVVATPLWGIAVIPPLDGSLAYLMTLADGAILAIAYLTSLGGQFE